MPSPLDDLFDGYPSLLSVAKLAEVLGVTQKTAYDYLQSADLPSYRIGNRWLILRDEIKNYIEQRARYTTEDATSSELVDAEAAMA
jgi:excisionase family DNA binding protein